MMKITSFIKIINSIHTLSEDQLKVLQNKLTLEFGQPNLVLFNLQKELMEHPECPHCQSDNIIHFGQANSRPRYRCKACMRTFVCTRGSQFFGLHKPDKWLPYLQMMCDSQTLQTSADHCEINLTTSFNWRHRFLKQADTDQPKRLSGIVEADETYFRVSEKGARNIKRPARKRGKRASKPGLSNREWTPVMVAIDRSHHEIDFILRTVNSEEVKNNLAGRLSPESILCTDGQPAYNQLCNENNILHKVIKGHQILENCFHINHVNAYHSRLKSWHKRFHGTATKYLSHYLGWFRTLEKQKYEKASIFRLLALQQHSFQK